MPELRVVAETIDGFCKFELKDGPDQLKMLPAFTFKLSVLPAQIGLLLVICGTGLGFTVTTTVSLSRQIGVKVMSSSAKSFPPPAVF